MRRLLQAGLAFGALAVPAAAADMAPYNKAPLPAPVFSWTGFYVGADVGGVWSSQDVSSACGGCGQAPTAGSFSANGFTGGLYSGYNWQVAPQWVIGVEGDWNWAKLGGSASAPNLFPNGTPVGSGGVSGPDRRCPARLQHDRQARTHYPIRQSRHRRGDFRQRSAVSCGTRPGDAVDDPADGVSGGGNVCRNAVRRRRQACTATALALRSIAGRPAYAPRRHYARNRTPYSRTGSA
jgi:opacity protein-like surface antigen